MKISHYYIILVYSLILLVSCDRTQNVSEVADLDDYFDLDFEALAKRYVPLDTIPLSDSIHYFNYDINIDRIKENKITAAHFPNLKVYMLDSTGQIQDKITQAGSNLEMLGNANFALTNIDNNGYIYVLTVGNIYRLFIYDDDFNFIKRFDLFKLVSESTIYVVNNSFKIINKNNLLKIYLSVGSTVYPRNSEALYENAFSVLEFNIDLEKLEVVDYKKHLPYRDVPGVKLALVDKKVWWNINNPVFQFNNNLLYISYPFSHAVYVYDSLFNFVNTIDLNILDSIPTSNYFKIMSKTIEDPYDRAVNSLRLSAENLKINHIDLKDNYLLVQFPEILKENGYYLPNKDEIGLIRDAPAQHLHAIVKNLETGEEKFITLPPDFYRIHIIDWNTFYGFHSSRETEYNALIKFRYE